MNWIRNFFPSSFDCLQIEESLTSTFKVSSVINEFLFNSNYAMKLRKISIQASLRVYLTPNFTTPRTFVSCFLCLGKLHELNSYELLTLDGTTRISPTSRIPSPICNVLYCEWISGNNKISNCYALHWVKLIFLSFRALPWIPFKAARSKKLWKNWVVKD